MIKSTAKISISRSSDPKKPIHISIVDEPSGNILCELYMSLKDFGSCITGLACIPADLEFYDKCPVGKERKQKEIAFKAQLGYKYEDSKDILHELVKPYEEDGWVANNYSISNDPFNHHKYTLNSDGTRDFKILFVKYV